MSSLRSVQLAGKSDLFLTPEQVGVRLQISTSKVYQLLKVGELRHIRIGRLWRVPQSAFDEYVAQAEGLT
jgi:excisionase family DNA binding protein